MNLLIDGDVIAYQIASSCEVATDWGDDQWTLHADAKHGKEQVDVWMADILLKLGEVGKENKFYVALTNKENFRKDILPTYKSNRTGRKPMILGVLKQHFRDHYNTFERHALEADDCLGILATMGDNELISGDRVIVSIDKDFKQIPGKNYNPSKPSEGIQVVDEMGADYWHFYQTLIGDKTDGYSGCPGVGPVKANAILARAFEEAGKERETAWKLILQAYEKAGLGPEEALKQARVARILRATDFNFETKEPILWEPPVLN